MNRLAQIWDMLADGINWRLNGKAAWRRLIQKQGRTIRHVAPDLEQLEDRTVPTLLGQQLFPADYPWNQNIANAPVASNSSSIISHIGGSIGIHPDWGEDSANNGTDPLYGIPFNVVHGNSTAKVNVIIDNYPGESDLQGVPIPANAVIEGDLQNGPNTNGPGYNSGQRGDSHLIIWDEDNNIAYELFGATRPSDPNNINEDPHTDGKWHAAQETVWNMNTNSFRTLGYTSADAAGLSILAGLVRPDEGLPVALGGQGEIDHALRFTLPGGDVNPQYIYPASHQVSESQTSLKLPFGARLRLQNTPAVNAVIATLGPEAQIIAKAMQQYGLVLADIGSAMYVTGASGSVNASNQLTLAWDMNDVLGLRSLKASDFDVVDLTPQVSGLSSSMGSSGNTITITGKNFSGSAGHLSVFFGTNNPSPTVTYIDDSHITAVIPAGNGTVDVTVQSGVQETDNNSDNPNANVTAPIFGYGTSATNANDLFTYNNQTISGTNSSFNLATSSVASGSGDTVTILVRDTNNLPVSGLPNSAFHFTLTGGTSTGTFGTVSETSTQGTYTATFTGVTAGSASTVNLTISSVQISSQPTVTVTPGPVNGTKTTVKFAAASVASGNTDTVTIVVEDAAGNVISGLANNAFTFSLTGGASTGTFGIVTETATPGTYTSTFTGVLAGSASSLNATVSGVQVSTHPTITVTPGTPSGSNSTASFATSSVASGSTDTVTIVVKDAAGNHVTGLTNSAFVLSLSGGTSTGTFGAVTETATAGTYSATFTGVIAGTQSSLSVKVSSIQLVSQPTVTVTVGPVNGGKSTVKFASSSVASGNTDTVTIIVQDAGGNSVTGLTNGAFALSLSGGTSTGTFGTVTETGTPGTYTTTFTGVLAGTASSLNATVSGVQITSHPTVTVTAGAPSGGNSTVSLASSSVVSGSTDTVTIVVKDAAGNHVTGLANGSFVLSLSGGTSTGSFGTVTETSTPGSYTATFTGVAAGTASAVNVTVSGVTIGTKPTVTVTSGPVNGGKSSVKFASSTVASGATDAVTIVVEDAAGNAVSGLSSGAFSLNLAGGTSTGNFSSVTTTSTPGTYTATFTGAMVGTASTLTVTVNGVQITTKPAVTVTAGSVSGGRSSVSFASNSVVSGSTDTVTIVAKDAMGNAVTGLTNASFAFSLSGGASSGTFGTVTETSTPGTYSTSFTGVLAGSASSLTATVTGIQLSSHPTVTVTAGPVNGGNSSAGFASPTVASGKTDAVTIVVKDAAGNAVGGLSGGAFVLTVSGGTSTGTFGSVSQTSTPGTYTATFTGALAGTATTLTVKVNSIQVSSQPKVTVTGGVPSGSKSTANFATSTIVSGSTDTATIVVKDAAGNAVSGLANSAFALTFSGGGSSGTFGTVTETGTPGTYTAVMTGVLAGSASHLTVKVSGVQLNSQPSVTVTPGGVSAATSSVKFASPTVASGKTDTVTITVKDAAGNAINGLTSSAFAFNLSGGTSTGTFAPLVMSSGSGVYTIVFTGVLAGTASTLTATVSGVQIATKPTVTVTAGAVSAANSTANFATPTVASGSTDTVTIVVKDAAGNAVTGLTSGAFGFGLGNGSSTGSFGTVTETSTPGTYTVAFTGKTAGTVSKLTVHVNGTQIVAQPTVTVTPGAVSGGNSNVQLASSSVAVGKTDKVTITVKDAAGNAITGLASAAFAFLLSGGTSAGTFGTVTETSTHGVYTVLFTGVTAGTTSTLTVHVNGVAITTQPKLTVTP